MPARGRRSRRTRPHRSARRSTQHSRRRPLRPARDRLRRPRQPVHPLDPRERPPRQHRPAARLVRARRRLGLDCGQPDRADRERAGAPLPALCSTAPPRPLPISGNQLTFATGALDRRPARPLGRARGRERHARPFRVAVTIESTPSIRSAARRAEHHLVRRLDADRPRRPRHRADAAERVADAADAAGLHPRPPRRRRPDGGGGFSPGTQIVDVTARWALAGTYVTEFSDPIEIIFSNPSGDLDDPGASRRTARRPGRRCRTARPARRCRPRSATASRDSARRPRPDAPPDLLRPDARRRRPDRAARPRGCRRRRRLDAALDPGHGRERPARQRRPLRQRRAATANSVRREFEAKLGAFAAGDTRTLHARPEGCRRATQPSDPRRSALCPRSPACASPRRPPRSAPPASPSARVREAAVATVLPGTVVGPADLKLALGVERDRPRRLPRRARAADPARLLRRRLEKRIELTKTTTIAARIKVSRPARRHRHAGHREEPAPLHVAAAGQGGRERGQAAAAGADPAAGHVQPHVGRALRHGDDSAAPSS